MIVRPPLPGGARTGRSISSALPGLALLPPRIRDGVRHPLVAGRERAGSARDRGSGLDPGGATGVALDAQARSAADEPDVSRSRTRRDHASLRTIDADGPRR